MKILARILVLIMMLAVLLVCGVLLPELAREEAVSNPNVGPSSPFLIGAWLFSIPVFIALFQVLKLLNFADQNSAFSQKSVKALKTIKICAIIFAALVFASVTAVIFHTKQIAPEEDFAGFAMLGMIFTFIPTVIAAFAAVIQKLFQKVLDMKLENDATV